MLKLNLFSAKEGEEKVDIYYSRMTPAVKQIISIVRNDKPLLYGTLDGEKVLLDLKAVLYFESVDRRTFAYTCDKVFQVTRTITSLEQELGGYGFVRINKSNVVNIYKIKRIRPEPNMRIIAVLENEEKLQINRGYKRSFEEYLQTVRNTI